MLLLFSLPLCLLLSLNTLAQVTGGTSSVTSTASGDFPANATYVSYGSTRTITSPASDSYGSMLATSSSIGDANSSRSTQDLGGSTSKSVTLLVGGQPTGTVSFNGTTSGNGTTNGTSTATSTSIMPTNTQPCNGHPEFCARKFSNITHIAAHNSPFSVKGNAASNQQLDVLTQLQDGIRMLQFQTHLENGTMWLCHTTCDLLNAGTLESYLTTVRGWVQEHPYDVITILMGNDDVVTPENYTSPVQNSGLMPYLYTPSKVPMDIDEWPTLQEMILKRQNVVMMLDYEANQTAVPWLLDEFAYMFETPFSPTNQSFPCTAQRPPEDWPFALPRKNRMYMSNHNLNVAISFAGISFLTPAYTLLNVTNADTLETGALMRNSLDCMGMWDRPPNYLLVDFYNIGNYNGSVFQVAATANNVSYDRDQCCGKPVSIASAFASRHVLVASFVGAVLSALFLI